MWKMKYFRYYAFFLMACLFIKQVHGIPFLRHQETSVETSDQDIPTVTDVAENQTTPVVMVTEPSNFWNDLYNQLKEIFYYVFPTDSPITEPDLVQTNESNRTINQTTMNRTNQILFKDFFASVANTFANIYRQFGSKSTNSSDIISNISPQQLFENKIDQFLQNQSLSINNANLTEELKVLVLDTLMSAWNDSLDLDELMVDNPQEIWDKFVDALQEIQDEQFQNVIENATTTRTTTTKRTPFEMDLDTFSANFLAILKQAEVNSNPDTSSRERSNMHGMPSSHGNGASWQDVLRIGGWGGK